jgi:hypothetical protein
LRSKRQLSRANFAERHVAERRVAGACTVNSYVPWRALTRYDDPQHKF